MAGRIAFLSLKKLSEQIKVISSPKKKANQLKLIQIGTILRLIYLRIFIQYNDNNEPGKRYKMRRIAFWSPKGGVGKTTLALNTAAAAYYAGYKVLLCDLDPQQSAVDIFDIKQLPFSVLPDMPHVMPNIDLLITDHPPSTDKIPQEETIVLPMRPSIIDLKAISKANRFIQGKRIIKCVNAVDTRRQDERMMAMKLYSEGALLIKDRSIYSRSLNSGKTVFQQTKYGTQEAKAEINRLLSKILAKPQETKQII